MDYKSYLIENIRYFVKVDEENPFTLASGKTSPIYLDLDGFISQTYP